MKSIYKYQLEPIDRTTLTLRGDVLSVGVQGQDIVVWAVHDDDAPARQVHVHVMGTGHLFVDAPESSFIGTVFLGPLVFHVFAILDLTLNADGAAARPEQISSADQREED